MKSGVRGLLGALLIGAAAVLALIARGGSSEGTVIAKFDQGVYHHACQVGGTLTGQVSSGTRLGKLHRSWVLAADRPRQRRRHLHAVRES